MPSDAYINFLHIRIDVIKMIQAHTHFHRANQKNLGYLTRSAVIMLCAAWERYNEDLLLESIKFLSTNVTNINLLNNQIKQTISEKVRADKNNIKPIELAGDGWKSTWYNYAKQETNILNTPKSEKLNLLFKKYLGIAKYTTLWRHSEENIDKFVSNRGDIAHNGNKANYIRMPKLKIYEDVIVENVIDIDGNMADELKRVSAHHSLPWIKDYSKRLEYYR